MKEDNKEGTCAKDMIHSIDEVLHALGHLMGEQQQDPTEQAAGASSPLEGHETMVLYRNVRKKYSSTPDDIKDGVKSIETFRTPEQGLEAAYRAAVCKQGADREASALYVAINPRHVSQGLALTNDNYSKWMEAQLGLTKEQPKGLGKKDYIGTLDRALRGNILKCQSRKRLDMIDVDDPDPSTWLRRIREAIGDEHIEMIVGTKNGYHVLYQGREMKPHEHRRLQQVLAENPGKGPTEKATRGKGNSVACALPGGCQSYHETKIVYCSCVEENSAEKENLP